MIAYRLALARFGGQLYTSGISGRWNRNGETVIYASTSRSLSILENLVHRGKFGMGANFLLFILNIPESFTAQIVTLENLSSNWSKSNSYSECQKIGSEWYQKSLNPCLVVPSAIIPEESNIVINAKHSQFSMIKIERVYSYSIDDRLKILI
jgi:RES domain-containing protein